MEPNEKMRLKGFNSRRGCFVLWCVAAMGLLVFPAQMRAAVEVPPRPASYLLDEGDVFPPEVEARIVRALKACAEDYDVHIYVQTVPSLKVMPSRIGEKLSEQLNETRKKWLAGQVGALIIFDDEAGRAMMGESDEAKNVFSAVALNMVMKDPKLQSKKKRSGPEKLAGTVTLLIQGLTELRTQANEEAQRQRKSRMIFGGIGAAVVLAGVGIFLLKWKPKSVAPKRRRSFAQES